MHVENVSCRYCLLAGTDVTIYQISVYFDIPILSWDCDHIYQPILRLFRL